MSIELRPAFEGGESEISALIETLIGAEQRLEELTGGEVDTVTGRDGRTFLLRHAQEQIRNSEAATQAGILNELRVLFDIVPAMIWFKNTENGFLRVNQRVADATGKRIEEIEGKSAYELFPREADAYYADDLEVIRSGRPKKGIIEKLATASGRETWIQTDKMPVCDKSGRVIGLVAMVQDVSERKRAEALLIESQHRLLLATESGHLGIWDWNVVTNEMVWDARMFEIYGVREQDFTHAYDAWQNGLHPEERDRGDAAIQAALEGAEDFHLEFRVVWPSGELRHIEAHALVQRSEDGSPLRMIGVNWDITERKNSEDALRESEERFRKMLEDIELLAMTLDVDGNVTFCNDYLLRVTGWNREDVLGFDWFSLFASQTDRDARRVLLDSMYLSGIPSHLESEIRTKSGQMRKIAWNIAMLRDRSGRVIGLASIGEDVTARRSLQEQLLQSQKMESLGSLAGGIAHDFNNLLTGMLGYAELAQSKLPPDSPIRPDLEEICKAANRAAALTKQLLSFARQEVVEPRIVDMSVLVCGLENLIRRLMGVDVKLLVRSEDDLGRVKLDPSQFEQVLVNLSVNARDAMPSGGTIVIATSNRTVDKIQETQAGRLRPGRYVVLSVTDTGVGMAKEVLSRIFDPFFTTKEKGKGTGLGLSTCYGIVTNSGGQIWAYSEIGVGTAFHIYFPRVDDPLTPQDSVQGIGIYKTGETVLVVEDEETVRSLAVEVLTSAGYRVLSAPNGDEATMLLADSIEPIDILLTDVVMPGMTGPQLAEVVALLRPEIKVLFMSGFTDDVILREGAMTRKFSFLQKPFSPAQLIQKVREVLDQEVGPV